MGSSGAFPAAAYLAADLVTVGQETFPRAQLSSTSAVGPISQSLRLTYFTARKSESSTQVRMYSGGTAAAATPSLCRIGLWTVAANGDLTLVASTANDTTLFAATTTAYTRSWSTPYTMVAGQRYAIGALVVSATTMPTFGGNNIQYSAESGGFAPILGAVINSQADLPASVASGSLAASGQRIYAVLF